MRSVLFIYVLFLKTLDLPGWGGGGGQGIGVLQISSDNDDRRIFLGLKFDFGILGGLENYGKHFLG